MTLKESFKEFVLGMVIPSIIIFILILGFNSRITQYISELARSTPIIEVGEGGTRIALQPVKVKRFVNATTIILDVVGAGERKVTLADVRVPGTSSSEDSLKHMEEFFPEGTLLYAESKDFLGGGECYLWLTNELDKKATEDYEFVKLYMINASLLNESMVEIDKDVPSGKYHKIFKQIEGERG